MQISNKTVLYDFMYNRYNNADLNMYHQRGQLRDLHPCIPRLIYPTPVIKMSNYFGHAGSTYNENPTKYANHEGTRSFASRFSFQPTTTIFK